MKKRTRWYNAAFLWKKLRVNRKYKDRLFRLRFGSEEYKEFDKPQYAHKGTDVFWKFIRSVHKGE